MTKYLLALAVAALLALAAGGMNGAEAKTSVHVYLGVPYYSYQVGPGYMYRSGYGWYRPRRALYRLSCGEARRILRRHGYYNIVAGKCGGRTYVFRAIRNGRVFVVYVDARTGALWRG